MSINKFQICWINFLKWRNFCFSGLWFFNESYLQLATFTFRRRIFCIICVFLFKSTLFYLFVYRCITKTWAFHFIVWTVKQCCLTFKGSIESKFTHIFSQYITIASLPEIIYYFSRYWSYRYFRWKILKYFKWVSSLEPNRVS